MHPTAIPGADKLRLISESVRGEGGRVWVPRDLKERRAGRDVPESARDYFLEDKYPGYGNLVPRDIASRELFKKCFHEKRGVYNADERRERERGVPRRDAPAARGAPQEARRRARDLREVRRRRPVRRTRCASSRPCTTRWAASGSTSSARRTARSSWARRATRRRASRASTRAARSTTSTTAPTGSARTRSSRASGAGMVAGPAIAAYRKNIAKERVGHAVVALRPARSGASRRSTRPILAMDGDENPYALHEELAQTMLVDCTIERHNPTLDRVLAKIEEIDERARKRRRDRHGDGQDEPGRAVRAPPAQHDRARARHRARARATATSRAARTSSRSSPQRDDANWLRTTLAFHEGAANGAPDGVRFVRELDYSLLGESRPRDRRGRREPRAAAPAQVRDGGRGERGGARESPRAARRRPSREKRVARRRASDDVQVTLKVKRQDGPGLASYWQEFEVPWQPRMNVISALMEIQKRPVTASGQKVDAGRLGVLVPRGGVRLVHDGHRRAGAAVVQRARRPDRPDGADDHARADDEVPGRSRPRRRPLADVRGSEEGQGVGRPRRLSRARRRARASRRRTRRRRIRSRAA